MQHLLSYALLFVSFSTFAISKPVRKRQAQPPPIDRYLTRVRTALYVLDSIRSDNASSSCGDADLPGRLDGEGYDGNYAQTLLCEVAIGIQIFPDVDQATNDLTTVLDGLRFAQGNSPFDPSRPLVCPDVDVDTLDDAGLDGPGIRDVICAAETSSTNPGSSGTSEETTSSERSSVIDSTTTSTNSVLTDSSTSSSSPQATSATPSPIATIPTSQETSSSDTGVSQGPVDTSTMTSTTSPTQTISSASHSSISQNTKTSVQTTSALASESSNSSVSNVTTTGSASSNSSPSSPTNTTAITPTQSHISVTPTISSNTSCFSTTMSYSTTNSGSSVTRYNHSLITITTVTRTWTLLPPLSFPLPTTTNSNSTSSSMSYPMNNATTLLNVIATSYYPSSLVPYPTYSSAQSVNITTKLVNVTTTSTTLVTTTVFNTMVSRPVTFTSEGRSASPSTSSEVNKYTSTDTYGTRQPYSYPYGPPYAPPPYRSDWNYYSDKGTATPSSQPPLDPGRGDGWYLASASDRSTNPGRSGEED